MSKDVKRMLGEIRQSLDAYPREQLVEILSYVFKEYVVEGAAPIAGTTALIDARTELEGLSFAELMTWLQLHLDVPELAQFEVQGARVSVRAGGRALPIEAAQQQPLPPVAPPPQQPAPIATPSVTTRPMPAPTQPSQAQAPSPSQAQAQAQPRSTPSQPTQNQPQQSAQNNQSPQNQATPNQPSTQNQQPEKKDDAGSPASRFSWLEVD